MRLEEGLTIATHNIYCGGIAFNESRGKGDIADWLRIHYEMLVAKNKGLIEKRVAENQRNPTLSNLIN